MIPFSKFWQYAAVTQIKSCSHTVEIVFSIHKSRNPQCFNCFWNTFYNPTLWHMSFVTIGWRTSTKSLITIDQSEWNCHQDQQVFSPFSPWDIAPEQLSRSKLMGPSAFLTNYYLAVESNTSVAFLSYGQPRSTSWLTNTYVMCNCQAQVREKRAKGNKITMIKLVHLKRLVLTMHGEWLAQPKWGHHL